jgi:hypothetical protein
MKICANPCHIVVQINNGMRFDAPFFPALFGKTSAAFQYRFEQGNGSGIHGIQPLDIQLAYAAVR